MDHGALSSLELKAREALHSICRGGFEDPLRTPADGPAKLLTELVAKLEGAAAKVDAILEGECHDLFFVAATRVFSHLHLPDPGFDFSTVVGPVPPEARAAAVEAVKGHVATLLGKFVVQVKVEPAMDEAGEGAIAEVAASPVMDDADEGAVCDGPPA